VSRKEEEGSAGLLKVHQGKDALLIAFASFRLGEDVRIGKKGGCFLASDSTGCLRNDLGRLSREGLVSTTR